MIDLSAVIVSWNVRDLLQQCLESLWQGKKDLALEVVVVDNASSDGSAAMVERQFPQVRLIANRENRGFTSGNNQGLAVSQGRYVLLLNPDAQVLGEAVAGMVAYMDGHPGVGVLGPQLIYPDGTIQPSRRRFPTLATAFLESTVLQLWWPINPILRRYYVADRSDDETQEVDWLVGACLLVRREAIEQVGGLDEGFFMYSEELDWCRRIKAAGWDIVYLPQARVVHHEGQSSGQVVAARYIYFHASKVRYFRKHHGPAQAEALRLFLLATFAYQLVVEALKWLLGHKRPLRRERVAAYRQVLRSGLRAARP